MKCYLTFKRNPTPNGESSPSSDGPITWENHSDEHRHYIFIGNDVTEKRENLRSQEASFWNNYFHWLTRDGPLHHPWQWDGSDGTGSVASRFNYAAIGISTCIMLHGHYYFFKHFIGLWLLANINSSKWLSEIGFRHQKHNPDSTVCKFNHFHIFVPFVSREIKSKDETCQKLLQCG